MVKNTTGGSKAKGQARKLVADKSKASKFLRVIQEEGEVYAKVEKLLGNGMCHVLCLDKVTRLCFIRGKFRGRGKKDNWADKVEENRKRLAEERKRERGKEAVNTAAALKDTQEQHTASQRTECNKR